MTRDDLIVTEPSHVGRARVIAASAAARAGLPLERVHLVSLAATELASNLLKHAKRGVFSVVAALGRVDVLAVDCGPGIGRIEDSMRDGFSTVGTMGGGLGAVRRAADVFDLYSRRGQGTAVLARWHIAPVRLPGRMRIGSAILTAPGETECGDRWTAEAADDTVTVAVSDGLGHGGLAARASDVAISTVAAHTGLRPARILELMQPSLASTRGATVAVAQLTPAEGRMRFSGVGNVSTRFYADPDRSVQRIVSRHGIVGVAARSGPSDSAYEWSPRSWLVLHTDGVSDKWSNTDWPGLFNHDPATVAGWILGQRGRGRDDACVLVVTGGGGR
ncbi:SpoIIE family protein phosphatase [Amycolatopsis thermophila]|uniref:Anti-sigma regulatory factor (Ser/Thr protein kinase) n=1 Tax=Amycolatopsis thermophila TaxID=206084 RepID=A0ABU0EVW5_9PSEU|nr:SpoIIE family protein phosphatase [Amycolatopsis thermophila]MDQ0379460.1 anti-sigma regulatory factor (Ser/Thr protein kinase) [Amycolatopsis thermophila]